MRGGRSNVILEKTIAFSLQIIKYCEVLDLNKKFIVSNQLLKAGTAIGANVFEAQHAESRADFVHKMKIAAKEASETFYWLLLCERSDGYFFDVELRLRLEEINKILSSIIASAKAEMKPKI
jgi:four helix bundle protein